ncbi:MAG TPA: D-Ala-D-Ala carboxypeptidase family metallohydrolase [Methanosarcina sp.]|nr:D-Ala-D-Ala carboxypeptidase family metallohydrolase [Methanosarcina sp.]
MKHFKMEEFICKCGCGQNQMIPETLDRIDKAREIANVPFKVTSGYRCVAHNAAVGGKSEGAHTTGHAVDIEASVSPNRFLIVDALLKVGFNRIGIGKTFIHADDDPTKPPKVMWEYV